MPPFRIVEHKLPGQHIREYPNATANSQEDVLLLSLKQYIPLDNENPRPGDVTIIGAHANAFPKETYEPFWEELLEQSHQQGWRIRSIWIADLAPQGQSGVLNEEILGNDPSWYDHSRDLLHVINTKRDEFPRPIIGIGNSVGACQLTYLSLLHPRLFTSLVLIDPTIGEDRGNDKSNTTSVGSLGMARLSTFRRTTWQSRKAAVNSWLRSPFYQAWDPRVFDRWVEFGLRDVSERDGDVSKHPQVALKTTAAQEVFFYHRPNYEGYGHKGKPVNRKTHPDLTPGILDLYPFYRAESHDLFRRLPEVRPAVLYVFGAISNVITYQAAKDEMIQATGHGVGGSGGAADGRVKGVNIEGAGHLVPLDKPAACAQAVAGWVADEVRRFEEGQKKWEQEWQSKSLREKQDIDEKWKEVTLSVPLKSKM